MIPAAAHWFSADELARLGLPGLPDDKRRMNALAVAGGWPARLSDDGTPLARARKGRGGGTEYHYSVLPAAAQAVILARLNREQSVTPTPIAANDGPDAAAERWAWFEAQSAATKAKAVLRASILAEIEGLCAAGTGKTLATERVAARHGVSVRAIADWFKTVGKVASADRCAFLAPAYKGGGRAIAIDAEAWRIIKTDYLRPEKPAFAACYNRLLEGYAQPRGIALPDMRTMKRRLDRETGKLATKGRREGREAVRRSVLPHKRSVLDLHAMEAVNVDGHTFDVFVQWEDGRIGRPVAVGIQDVFSRKTLAHRIGETENTVLTRMAFADLFRDYGIPLHAVMDNGRAFASKALTGGAKTRFRFKIKDTDPTGVLTALGVAVHWTLPYRGSSKPIERQWKIVCEEIAKHPFCAGAYTGNKPDAKPENYRERAIPIAEFRAHVARQLALMNARGKRRTETANGGSYDDAFAASYAAAPIGKARPEQLRLALLEATDLRCHKENGSITLMGNRYWSVEMIELAGRPVTVRFDPDNLHADLHVYLPEGKYYGVAPVIEAVGFFDKSGAETRAKLEAQVRRKFREAEAAADLLHVNELADLLSGAPAPAALPEPTVVRPVRHRGNTAAALKPIEQAVPVQTDSVDRFTAGIARLRVVE